MKVLLLLIGIATADFDGFYDTDYDGHLYEYDRPRSKLICSKVCFFWTFVLKFVKNGLKLALKLENIRIH